MRIAAAVLVAALVPVLAHASESDQTTGVSAERNAAANSTLRTTSSGLAAAAKKQKRNCAVAFFPGPPSSIDTTMGLTSLIPAQLSVATINPFRAFNGKGLVLESAFPVSGPTGGTTTVLYPAGGDGRGPAVLEFTDFNQDDLAIIAFDPDTFSDPGFTATVKQLARTTVEVTYGNNVRCSGTFAYDNEVDALVAVLKQNFP